MSEIGTSEDGAVLLPEDAVTQGFAILARRRSGKSNLAGVIEETFCERGDPWVCLDPVSAHWGIRYRDENGQPGKPSGYDVMIVGGKYGDVALDEKGGGALAQIIVDTGISCVVDLGGESMNARQKFVADFAIELLKINTTPRHVILEEADEFVPQMLVWDNQKYVRGALTRLIKQGGGLGIGFSLISQRPASVAKDVLEQIDHLFVLRMKGPNDLKAVQSWFEHNVGDKAAMAKILTSIASFAPGDAWLCSSEGELEQFRVRERRTYHAGRTPKRGEALVAPKRVELKQVIGQYRAAAEKRQIAVKVERDLQAENAALKKQLAARVEKAPILSPPCEHEAEIEQLERELAASNEWRESVERSLGHANDELLAIRDYVGEHAKAVAVMPTPAADQRARTAPVRRAGLSRRTTQTQQTPKAVPVSRPQTREQNGNQDVALSGMEQRILNAIAWWEAIGVAAPKKHNIGFVAGYRVTKKIGGAFGSALGELVTRGLISYPAPGCASLTADGRTLAEAPAEAPSIDVLHATIFDKLDSMEQRVLRVFVDAYPDEIGKQEAGERAGYTIGPKIGGAYGSCLGTLKELGLIDYPRPGVAIAAPVLFPEGL